MNDFNKLKLGDKYTKLDLADLLEIPQLRTVREGIYTVKETDYVLFFVTLDKGGAGENLHYNDYFEGGIFHWDSQNKQHIASAFIQKITSGEKKPLLFARIHKKSKSKTSPFVYCGQLEYLDYLSDTSRPVHLLFSNIEYDPETTNQDLVDIYQWTPETTGKSKDPKITESSKILNKPTKTERQGLVTSRVGQGYYRQLLVKKWKGKCAVTSCDLSEILIASHIVPWRESTEEERLDHNNGILLSPLLDALFDKHLISFDQDGAILISEKISESQRNALNLNSSLKLSVDKGMIKYLDRHRAEFLRKQRR